MNEISKRRIRSYYRLDNFISKETIKNLWGQRRQDAEEFLRFK